MIHRRAVIIVLAAAACAGAPAATAEKRPIVAEFYDRRPSLAETLLASRAQYGTWQKQQSDATRRKALREFWESLRADFRPDEFPLVDFVPCSWVDSPGWLGGGPTVEQEQAAMEDALAAAGEWGGPLRTEYNRLRASGVGADDSRWLRACAAAAGLADASRRFQALRLAIEDLRQSYGDRYRAAGYAGRWDALRTAVAGLATAAWDRRDPARTSLGEAFKRLQYDALVAGNPLLSPGKLLFQKRPPHATGGWYYGEFMFAHQLFRSGKAEGGLFVLSLPEGRVMELTAPLRGGLFDRYDLSFDGLRLVFGYKAAPGKAFRLYEAHTDGTRCRQLTFDPPDEPQRVERYRGLSHATSDDFHPCYLPDGGIAFASARCQRRVICDAGGRLVVNVLHRIDADGGNLRRLSEGALSESTPAVTGDGRILYTRWEYVDKGVIAVQSLWTMHPDGSASREVYGNDIADPMVLIHGRPIPGHSAQFVCTATFHHPFAVGPLLWIDATRPTTTLDPIRSLTPDTQASPGLIKAQTGQPGERFAHWRNRRWTVDDRGPLFSEPYALADPATGAGAGKYFLADWNPDQPLRAPAAYALCLVDVFGNRVEIYRDPATSCWQPMLQRPRTPPPILPAVAAGERSPVGKGEATGTLVLQDVDHRLGGVPRGTVKYLRILEQVPVPWSARRFWPDDVFQSQHVPIGKNSHIHVKVLHGVVPVHPDGSAHFTVPARRNLFFQALDEHFMEIQRMRTFVNLQPGEARSCIGCHERAQEAPLPTRGLLALAGPPAAIAPQPGDRGPRPIHYPTDVQPILDRHCVRCHGQEKPGGGLELTGVATAFFNRSYENIQDRRLVACIAEFQGEGGDQFGHVRPLPPRMLGSYASRLITLLRDGHHEVTLPRDEWVRLVTWADANAPYYGSYFGRRNLVYRGLPDFRPTPSLRSALGVEPDGTPPGP